MLTYWLVGEDSSRRIERLKPPPVMSSARRSPRPYRSPNALQKISSLPILRAGDSLERDTDDEVETDKLLTPTNGFVSHKQEERQCSSTPCCKRSALSPRYHASGDRDWYSHHNRRSASVKIKFTDECIPEHGVLGEQKRRDSLWDNFTTKDDPEGSISPCHEGSPLLYRQGITELEMVRVANGMARSTSADTSV